MLTGALKGMVSSLNDPYTYYLTAEEYQDLLVDMVGSYDGIGLRVTVMDEDNMITVVNAFKDGPAAEAGIVSGDKIIRVNGEDVDGSMLDEAVRKMRERARHRLLFPSCATGNQGLYHGKSQY